MNNIITTIDDQLVTTTMAIADGTGNQHKNVLELVRTYRVDLEEFGGVAFETAPFETAGGTQQREIAILNEQQSTLILTYMRNSDIVRAFKKRLVKEFWEMRRPQAAKPAFVLPDFTNPAIAARAWADQVDKVQLLEVKTIDQKKQLEVAQPKAEALDLFSTFAEGSMCLTNAAKALQIQPKKFFAWMQEHQWIYRRAGGSCYVGYQSRIQVGHLEHKVTTVERTDGTTKQVEQVLVTAKGLSKLALLLIGKAPANDSSVKRAA